MTRADITLSSTTVARIGRLVRLLGSDRSGEVVAAATAIKRTLSVAGADMHHLADVVERGLRPLPPPPPPPPAPIDEGDIVGEMIRVCLLYPDQLSQRELGFVESLKKYQRSRGAKFEPSEKQFSWLVAIFDRVRE
jgi:hypothetical protein